MQYKKQTPKPKNKPKQKHQQANNTNQTQEQGTSRQVDSCSVHGQLEDARRDDNIVSPQGLVWQCKTKAKNRQQSAIQQSVSQEATKAQCGNQGSPQPGASRSQSASRTGNILTDSWIRFKSQQDAVLSHLVRRRKVKRGVKAELR